jgi:hypothetical protein
MAWRKRIWSHGRNAEISLIKYGLHTAATSDGFLAEIHSKGKTSSCFGGHADASRPMQTTPEALRELSDYNINPFILFQREDPLVRATEMKVFDLHEEIM